MSRGAKRLKDIRYFVGAEVPGPGRSPPSQGEPLPRQAHRLGQRIACLLEAEGLSLADYDHLYVVLTRALPPGRVEVAGFRLEPWFRYVACGIGDDFGQWPEPQRLRYIEEATFDCLATLVPGSRGLIRDAQARSRKEGARLRVLRARKETGSTVFEVWFDVPAFDDTAHLYAVAIEGPCSKGNLNLNRRQSFRAALSTSGYRSPIRIPLAAFKPTPQ